MLIVSSCMADDPALRSLVDAMTAELIPVYELPPDVQPAPLASVARYLLARKDDQAVGCCAVQPIGAEIWELKRMFVSPAARGTGVADLLLAEAEQLASGLGGRLVRLETGVRQPAAMRLYERTGYRRIANYSPHDEDPLSVCYEKALPARSSRVAVGE
ncbi:GNAT family N-acetyltransferase [Streptomyces sp. NBC_01788]|uniref:GNAT family N-acetyltransferase n=1 Tax=unclassified Streptomyces TaxID=2593676 RepID=UPI002DD98BE1|nr:GNAT family N-acetyltransferase [Streptomyces sp. NBC_01788]WSB25136.1 GNAT family N-acetyltransferase [Streptomyces sp. NBC_01788]